MGRQVPGAAAVIATVCTGHDYRALGKPQIDWTDPQACNALACALVNDANAVLATLTGAVGPAYSQVPHQPPRRLPGATGGRARDRVDHRRGPDHGRRTPPRARAAVRGSHWAGSTVPAQDEQGVVPSGDAWLVPAPTAPTRSGAMRSTVARAEIRV